MSVDSVQHLTILAGRGVYPMELAECARAEGVGRVDAVCFRGETDRALLRRVDRSEWVSVGSLGSLLSALEKLGARDAVMAGQIRPTNLFRIRFDAPMRALLARLPVRNAETIFGAVGDELCKVGVDLHPASMFMERAMPAPGLVGGRPPTETEERDLALGAHVAKAISGLDIGQTVVVKAGTILAVEAFEGTDRAILRAGRLGGPGGVVVKAAKRGHDMRFDIPVIGLHSFRVLRRAGISALGVEAGRTILLQREQLIEQARRWNMAFTALRMEQGGAE
ncbi:MAG: UDP-2,3-diacylglucosamine diphosphatase LpxI [Kiritimatiellia bacterium]|nr:UDP-2,3-diacylglucosamine diphosphatase LpxI [Kiritimatiellia bacterium]